MESFEDNLLDVPLSPTTPHRPSSLCRSKSFDSVISNSDFNSDDLIGLANIQYHSLKSALGSNSDQIVHFQKTLYNESIKYLEEAINLDNEERIAILNDLYYNLTSPADHSLLNRFNIILNSDQQIYYFEFISDLIPDNILPCIYPIWSAQIIPSIFSLLYYKHIFNFSVDDFDKTITIFLKGANDLFWNDIIDDCKISLTIFDELIRVLTKEAENYSSILDVNIYREIFGIVSRFYLYYYNGGVLHDFLMNIKSDYLKLRTNESVQSLFISCYSQILPLIENENVLLRYLEQLPTYQLDLRTSWILQSLLSNLSTPGGPLFPTYAIRKQAVAVLDRYYPEGSVLRHLIVFIFRLLHPYYWFESIYHHISARLYAIYLSFIIYFAIILQKIQNLFSPE